MTDIMKVMDAAKKIMRQSGNMHQWGEYYPSEAIIMADIERNGGFVIAEDDGEDQSSGKIVGYFAFLSSPEPTYARIYEGKWLDEEQPYQVTLHVTIERSLRMTNVVPVEVQRLMPIVVTRGRETCRYAGMFQFQLGVEHISYYLYVAHRFIHLLHLQYQRDKKLLISLIFIYLD
ncbi:MAG: hypothetical protein IJ612_05840 [Prevotella sp.]|nr:hypothetical protein [Prevotella sp.]